MTALPRSRMECAGSLASGQWCRKQGCAASAPPRLPSRPLFCPYNGLIPGWLPAKHTQTHTHLPSTNCAAASSRTGYSPARPLYPPTASNLLPTPYGGLGITDGRHLRALSPGRGSSYFDLANIPVVSGPRALPAACSNAVCFARAPTCPPACLPASLGLSGCARAYDTCVSLHATGRKAKP